MKKFFVLCAVSALAVACGGGDKPADSATSTSTTTTASPAASGAPASSATPAK
jgi:hypothetical protein